DGAERTVVPGRTGCRLRRGGRFCTSSQRAERGHRRFAGGGKKGRFRISAEALSSPYPFPRALSNYRVVVPLANGTNAKPPFLTRRWNFRRSSAQHTSTRPVPQCSRTHARGPNTD